MRDENMGPIREIFAKAFLVTRKWEVLFNRLSGDDLTLKQFMLVLVIRNGFREDPTLRQLAAVLETSHQNVKAMILLLSKNEFVEFYTDQYDKRVTRVKLLNKDVYWTKRFEHDQKMLMDLFEGISYEDLITTSETIEKLYQNADKKIKHI